MTPNTAPLTVPLDALSNGDDVTALLLTSTAQQAVLPRKLEEGVYGVLNPEGGVDITETPGYTQQREEAWLRARSDRPEFVHRSPVLLDVDSFVDYLARNTTGSTAEVEEPEYVHAAGALELWADIDGRKITAILDGYDGLRQHTATLALKVSREWAEWSHIDGKLFPQADFAEFIADHLSTIAAPDGALLVDICETLTGKTDVRWKSQHLDRNGQRAFTYEEQVDGQAGPKGDLPIPAEFLLAVRPFAGAEPEYISARFRFRLRDGGLVLGVKLVEPERRLEDAFARIVEDVQGRVPVHVNLGRTNDGR